MTQFDTDDVPKRTGFRLTEHLAVGGLIVGGIATLLWLGLLVTLGGWAAGIIEF
ncbi:hypothetical protein AIGOOFII_3404 [Methylobacterium marchantiae]|nr:hypothetical protein AIGOOFII_3404 [Methylobacterium marchantiae]